MRGGEAARLRLDESLLRSLASVDWKGLGICHVILFGSLAERGEGSDIDLLLVPCEPRTALRVERLVELAMEVSERTGIAIEHLDLVDIGRAECPLLVEAWRKGVIVYTVSRSKLLDVVLPRLAVCEDEELAARRLRVVETAVKAARRRWG